MAVPRTHYTAHRREACRSFPEEAGYLREVDGFCRRHLDRDIVLGRHVVRGEVCGNGPGDLGMGLNETTGRPAHVTLYTGRGAAL